MKETQDGVQSSSSTHMTGPSNIRNVADATTDDNFYFGTSRSFDTYFFWFEMWWWN